MNYYPFFFLCQLAVPPSHVADAQMPNCLQEYVLDSCVHVQVFLCESKGYRVSVYSTTLSDLSWNANQLANENENPYHLRSA